MLLANSQQQYQIIINTTPAGTTQKPLHMWVTLPVAIIGWLPYESPELYIQIGWPSVSEPAEFVSEADNRRKQKDR